MLQPMTYPASSGKVQRAVVPVVSLLLFTLLFAQAAAHANQSAPCNPGLLPTDVQNQLKQDYRSWKIQETTDLSQRARGRWANEKPAECPGIAVGYFESSKFLSYAVLLVPAGQANASYRLLVFSQRNGQPTYEAKLIDKLDQNGAANYFIRKTPISKFFDEPSRRKFQAHTIDGILLVDSAENEYEVDVYFWSGGRYRNEPIDY